MTGPRRRPARHGQRGQMIPLVAIAAMVLLAATALAVDLSLQTHDQRTLQNVTDVAALSGAQDLPASPTATDQYAAAQDALQMIRNRMGWSGILVGSGTVTNTAWATSLAATCSSSSNTTIPPACDITKTVCSSASPAPSDLPATCDSYANLNSNAHYFSVTIQTPAKTSHLSSPSDVKTSLNYFEVTMTQDTQNYLAGVIGKGTSTQGARSTAYHFAPNQSFGFALFAKTIVQTQNKPTLVVGDVYADRHIEPQSDGQAGFCAYNGLIVLGTPQDGNGVTPTDGQAEVTHNGARPITYDPSACTATVNNASKGSVTQTKDPTASCSVGGTSNYSATYDANNQVKACVANPALTGPTEPAPTVATTTAYGCVTATATSAASPGKYSCTTGSALTIASSTAKVNPGVYYITHNPSCSAKSCYDVDISANIALSGVTFWLDQGATIGVHGNSTAVSINPAPAVSSSSPGDGRFPIYAPTGSVAQVWVTDNGAHLDLFGTMYIPDGVAHTFSNGYFTIDGQAIVGTWDDQGGNHTTADITYDSARNGPQSEVLKLME